MSVPKSWFKNNRQELNFENKVQVAINSLHTMIAFLYSTPGKQQQFVAFDCKKKQQICK